MATSVDSLKVGGSAAQRADLDAAVLAATAAKTAAELARDVSLIQAGVYATEAEGRAAVADGQAFKVQGSGDIAAYEYRRTNSSTSALIATYPRAEIVSRLAALRNVNWLSRAALDSLGTADTDWLLQHRIAAANAIKAVSVTGGSVGESYCVAIFTNNDATFKDRITISNAAGSFVADSGNVAVTKNPAGLTRVVVGTAPQFTLWINYNELSQTGVLVNGARTPLVIAPTSAFMALDQGKASTDDLTKLAGRVGVIESGDPSRLTNVAVNGALDPAGAVVAWRSLATVVATSSLSPAPAVLASRGIVQVADFGSGIATAGLYKREEIGAQHGQQYFFASAYVTSGNGTNYAAFSVSPYAGSSTSVLAETTDQANGFVQIDTYTRLYWRTGRLPNRGDLSFVLLGGAKASIPDSKVGGYTLAFSAAPISIESVLQDNWDGLQRAGLSGMNSALSALAEKVGASSETLARAVRLSFAGSSITWGGGYLGEGSYVGGIEEYVRTRWAETVHAANITFTGTVTAHTNPCHFRGSARRMSGVGSEAAFSLTGDELSLVLPRERGNEGACIAELYVNNVLHDTFEVVNSLPFATGKVANFTGDGAMVKFDLGECYTFGHVVTVGGAAMTGSVNTAGSGAGIPAGADYTIIRQMVMVNGAPEVHHVLWLSAAPAAGVAVQVTYSAGESIQYMRSFLSNAGKGLDTALENPYGDGNVAYDPANPVALSSGLGFRASDERAVKTWRFQNSKKRSYRLRIKSLAPQATGATPVLWINFATNRMHHFQNAGIGGWGAMELRDSTGLNNIKYVNEFRPDAVLIEFCTNDDRASGTHQAKAYVTRTGLTDAQVRGVESANYLRTVTYVGPNNYTVEDERIPIASITATSATLVKAGATFSIAPGDAIIFGDFRLDNRRVTTRIVKTWDEATGTVTWGRPLRASDLAHIKSLSELVGTTVRVRNAGTWRIAMTDLAASLRASNPDVSVIFATGGIPNDYDRRLEGYREMANDLAATLGAGFADFYGVTRGWAYSQPPNAKLYLNASQSKTSTGASRYPLFLASGSKPDPMAGGTAYWRLMITSIKVNGVERINDGCYIEGGRKVGWTDATTQMSKANTTTSWGSEYALVFSSNVPAAGADIDIGYSTVKWALDDCHPNQGAGNDLFPFGAFGPLKAAVLAAIERAGLLL